MNEPCIAALNPEERTRCEVWTRVMGYHRPVSAFNLGKRAEHQDRCYFTEDPRGTPRHAVSRPVLKTPPVAEPAMVRRAA